MAETTDDAGLLRRWRHLASAYTTRGQSAEACAALRRVLALAPADSPSRFQLALDAERRGDAGSAIAGYWRGLAVSLASLEAIEHLGSLSIASNRARATLAILVRARTLHPDSATLEGEIARVATALREDRMAVTAGRRQLALAPAAMLPQVALGQSAFNLAQRASAIAHMQRVAMLGSEIPELQFLAGRNLYLLGEKERGVALMQRAVDLDFGNPQFHEHIYYFHMLNQADWPTRRDYTRRVGELVRAAIEEDSARFLVNPVLFLFLAVDSRTLFEAARHFARHRFAPREPAWPADRRTGRGRIRLGYLSSKLWDHHIGAAQLPIVAAHDRDAFEVYLYSTRADDRLQERLAAAAHAFRAVDGADREAFQRAIAADGLDILVDLDGYLSGNDGLLSLSVMSQRIAPLQMLHHCYVGPTGTDFVDYVIGDSVLFGPGIDAFYSEKLIRLPPSYYPAPPLDMAMPESDRGKWGLPAHGFVLANFGGFYKIDPTAFAAWMRILARIPNAVLWLNDYDPVGARNLRRAAAAAGIEPERLVFTPPPPAKADHLARLSLADLFIDTFLYTSGVTSLDALWAGLPVLTLIGETMPARVGASLNAGIGMEELSATTVAGFEAMAVELAQSPVEMARLKAQLRRNRETHPLFDSARLARNLERAYTEAWRIYQSGAPARAITLEGP
ncbi:MAG: hypothetical protein HYR63_14180 [Proteobacteria bacterium]|nr:hypothetical protein [Pseudomonadota bacterium]MBI3498801.1 hypothetical protein [Pseudomonadota bacterium]